MICAQPGCREQATVRHARLLYCKPHYTVVHLAHMKAVCQKKREAKTDELERMMDEITPGDYERSVFFGRMKIRKLRNGTFHYELV